MENSLFALVVDFCSQPLRLKASNKAEPAIDFNSKVITLRNDCSTEGGGDLGYLHGGIVVIDLIDANVVSWFDFVL